MNSNWYNVLALGLAMTIVSACNEELTTKGDVDFAITDASIDDTPVKGVFVTIADVRVNGQPLFGFSKTTINLKAFQEGSTKYLGNARLDSRTYNNIELVLDLDHDANGNSPGCYILTTDHSKYKLRNAASGIVTLVIDKPWTISGNANNTVVIDFDLRKTIVPVDEADVRYAFVTDHELTTAIRVVNQAQTGTITGTIEESLVPNGKILVYAYRKGTFNATIESQPQGEGHVPFLNSVVSAAVRLDLRTKTYTTFTLTLLEAGDYELYYALYQVDLDNGRLIFQNLVEPKSNLNVPIGNKINVQGGVTTILI